MVVRRSQKGMKNPCNTESGSEEGKKKKKEKHRHISIEKGNGVGVLLSCSLK